MKIYIKRPFLASHEIKCVMNSYKPSANYIINFRKIKRQIHIDILPKETEVDEFVINDISLLFPLFFCLTRF